MLEAGLSGAGSGRGVLSPVSEMGLWDDEVLAVSPGVRRRLPSLRPRPLEVGAWGGVRLAGHTGVAPASPWTRPARYTQSCWRGAMVDTKGRLLRVLATAEVGETSSGAKRVPEASCGSGTCVLKWTGASSGWEARRPAQEPVERSAGPRGCRLPPDR